MKIFHIGICVYPDPIWISRALMKKGEYRECRPEDSRLLEIYNEFKPDLVFIQVQSPVINLETIQYLSKESIVINWMGDVRVHTERWFYQWSPYVVNCFSNMRDVDNLWAGNNRTEFLQIGIDPLIFYNRKPEKKHDIVFMANRYNNFPLSGFRQKVIYYLKNKYHERFKLLGNGWPMSDGNLNQSQTRESEFYSESKIAISISHFDIDRYFSDRLLRAMGSGCFTLSHNYHGIEKDFTIGEHLDTFGNEQELEAKINYYLQQEDERERIALNGYDHVHANFTTDNMADEIIKIYDKYK